MKRTYRDEHGEMIEVERMEGVVVTMKRAGKVPAVPWPAGADTAEMKEAGFHLISEKHAYSQKQVCRVYKMPGALVFGQIATATFPRAYEKESAERIRKAGLGTTVSWHDMGTNDVTFTVMSEDHVADALDLTEKLLSLEGCISAAPFWTGLDVP